MAYRYTNKPIEKNKIIIMFKLTTIICCTFFANISFSQAEKNCIKVLNDDITATTQIVSDEIDLGDFKVYVLAGNTRGMYPKLIFKIKEDVCIDNFNLIYFMFRNGKRFQGGNFVFQNNCKGSTGQIINNLTLSELLKSEKLKTLRLDTRNSFIQIDLTEEQSDLLNNYVNCALDWKSYKDQIKYKTQGRY